MRVAILCVLCCLFLSAHATQTQRRMFNARTALKTCPKLDECKEMTDKSPCPCPKVTVVFVKDNSGSVSICENEQLDKAMSCVTPVFNPGGAYTNLGVVATHAADDIPGAFNAVVDKILEGKSATANIKMLEAELAPITFGKTVAPLARSDKLTDLQFGMRSAINALCPPGKPNKPNPVIVVMFDGSHNVMSYKTIDEQMRSKTPGLDMLKAIVSKGQAAGAKFFFIGVDTNNFQQKQNELAQICGEAGKLAKPVSTDVNVKKCLGTKVHNKALLDAMKACDGGDAAVCQKVNQVLLAKQDFFADQAAQIKYLQDNLGPTLQYQNVASFSELITASNAVAHEICSGTGSVLHFDSSVSNRVCTSPFFECAKEFDVVKENLKCCTKETRIWIGGHTSKAGNEATNLGLAKGRTQYAVDLLRGANINNELVTGAFAASQMVDTKDVGDESTKESANNRRVEIYCTKILPKSAGVFHSEVKTYKYPMDSKANAKVECKMKGQDCV